VGARAEPSQRRTRRLFIDLTPLRRSRDFRFLIFGELVSVLGTQLTTVAVPYQVYRLTHSSLDVGLVSLAQLFPLIAGSLLGGSVVDAMDRRRLLMAAQVLPALCSVGLAVNAALALIPAPGPMATRAGFLAAGIGLNALATALYIGARLGPGPRDGLMTGLAARGHPIRVVRTGIEITVLLAGIALGGTAGIGTLAYALAIGPLVQWLLPRLTVLAPPAGPCPSGKDGGR